MKVIYGLKGIRKFKKPVVALGVFDGVHRGHRIILKSVVAKARKIKGTSVVLTFWPDPHKQQSLYSLEHRLRLIQEIGMDVCIVLKFSRQIANLTASDFVKNILFKKIKTDYIYVGKNFRFGRDARGDIKLLGQLSRIYNFKLKVFDVFKINHQPISSTYIRELIKKGKLKRAQRLLSRPVSILGTVIKGSFLARKLGFPTANIKPHHEVIPQPGIYAVRNFFKEKKFYGICYIGTNPTLKAQKTIHVEVNIFDFKKNIYGRDLEIQFVKKIRDEKKFDSRQSLVKRIEKDIQEARSLFSRH